jgi:hypothetical protein
MNQVIHEVQCQGGSAEDVFPQRQSPILPSTSYLANNQPSNNNNNNNRIPNVLQKQPYKPMVDDLRPKTYDPVTLIKCDSCHKDVPALSIETHKNNDCEGMKIPCEFCNTPIQGRLYTAHLENCSQNPEHMRTNTVPENIIIPCENCNNSCNAANYESHLQQCLQTTTSRRSQPQQQLEDGQRVECEICSQQVPFSKYEDHIRTHERPRQRAPQPQQQQQQRPSGYSNDPFSMFSNDSFNNMMRQMMPQQGFPPANMGMGGPSGQTVIFNNGVQQQPAAHSYSQGRTQIVEERINPDGTRTRIVRTGGGNQPMTMMMGGGMGGMDSFMTQILGGGNGDLGGFLQSLGIQVGPPPSRGLDNDSLQEFGTAKYDKEKNKNLPEELKKCPICISEFEDGEDIKFLPCTHRFHITCIDHWLKENSTCPICKKDFKNLDDGENTE